MAAGNCERRYNWRTAPREGRRPQRARGPGPGAVKGRGSSGVIIGGFLSSRSCRFPEGLWDTTKQEIQKPVSFLQSISQSRRTCKQTFPRPSPSVVKSGLVLLTLPLTAAGPEGAHGSSGPDLGSFSPSDLSLKQIHQGALSRAPDVDGPLTSGT